VLDAASTLTPEQFARVSDTFAHLLGTQLFWYSNWTGGEFDEEGIPSAYADLRAAYGANHADLRAFFAQLTDDGWHRADQWWLRWGIDARLPLGETLFQVVNHSTQHRSEIAVVISEMGASPGDLDYLVFKQGP
jgi:uncharacterized damage-inducible protein DinB